MSSQPGIDEVFTCSLLSCRLTRRSCGRRHLLESRDLAPRPRMADLVDKADRFGSPCARCPTGAANARALGE